MRFPAWLILGLTAFINLVIGAFGAFTLLIALNGFPEATGGAILLAYAVLFLFMLIGAGVAQWAALKFITAPTQSARTQWPLWLVGPALILVTVFAVGAALAVGVLVIMLAFGAG